MKVEVLYAPGCANCQRELGSLRAAAITACPALEWQELDILQVLDYAVELGVLKTPALAIDGKLAFASLPTAAQLIAALQKFQGERKNGR